MIHYTKVHASAKFVIPNGAPGLLRARAETGVNDSTEHSLAYVRRRRYHSTI